MTALEIIRQQAFLDAADLIWMMMKDIDQSQNSQYALGAYQSCLRLREEFLCWAQREVSR